MTHGVRIGNIDTKMTWGLILMDGLSEGAPQQKKTQIDIPGADGVLDVSTALSDGLPVFNNRTVSFSLFAVRREDDETTFARIYSELCNHCAGKLMKVWLPTDPDFYYYGRVAVGEKATAYNVLTVPVSIDADPYRYKNEETEVSKEMTGNAVRIRLGNLGRRVFPTFVNSGTGAITLAKGTSTYQVPAGTSQVSGFYFEKGVTEITATGTSGTTLTIKYQEAIL